MSKSLICFAFIALVIAGCGPTRECTMSYTDEKKLIQGKTIEELDNCLEEANRFADTVNFSVCLWVRTSESHKVKARVFGPIADGVGTIFTALAAVYNQKPTQALVALSGAAVAFGTSFVVSICYPDDDEYATQALAATSDLQTAYNDRILKKRFKEAIDSSESDFEQIENWYSDNLRTLETVLAQTATTKGMTEQSMTNMQSLKNQISETWQRMEQEKSKKGKAKAEATGKDKGSAAADMIDALAKFKVAIEDLKYQFPGEALFPDKPAFIQFCWGKQH